VDRGEDLGLDGTLLIDRLTDNVQDAAKSPRTHGDHDRSSGVLACLSTDKTLSSLHGNGAHGVLTKMLGDLENEARLALGHSHLKGVQNRRQVTIELDIHHGTNDLGHTSCGGGRDHTCGVSTASYYFDGRMKENKGEKRKALIFSSPKEAHLCSSLGISIRSR